MDVLGALLGDAGACGRTALLQQDNGASDRFGYREGKWKLVRLPRKIAGKAGAGPAPIDAVQESLYDLATDPGETTDVAEQFPDVAARVRQALDREIATLQP